MWGDVVARLLLVVGEEGLDQHAPHEHALAERLEQRLLGDTGEMRGDMGEMRGDMGEIRPDMGEIQWRSASMSACSARGRGLLG